MHIVGRIVATYPTKTIYFDDAMVYVFAIARNSPKNTRCQSYGEIKEINMNFYVISNHLFDDRTFAMAEEKDPQYDRAPRCEKCGAPIGMRKWLPPYQVKLSKKKIGDVTFGSVFPFLLSRRAAEAIQKHELKGVIEMIAVEIVNHPDVGLYWPVIQSQDTLLIDEVKSGVIRNADPPQCPFCHVGATLYWFDYLVPIKDTWKGQDLLIPPQFPGFVVVSERFVAMIKEERLTNFKFTLMEQFPCPWKRYKHK
jgi:hypothetical protein